MTVNIDSFGNRYFNRFSNSITRIQKCETNVESGLIRDSAFWLPDSAVPNGTTGMSIRFPNSVYETVTEATTLGSNFRFYLTSSTNPPNVNYADTATTGNNTIITWTNSHTKAPYLNTINYYCVFGVQDDDSIILAVYDTTSNEDEFFFRGLSVIGYAVDPDPGVPSLANTFFLGVHENGSAQVVRLEQAYSSTLINIQSSGNANYTITCKSDAGHGTTPSGLWTSNLALVDETTDKVVGTISSNLLLGKGGFIEGQLYQITGVGKGEANLTPNTEQTTYLCVCPWGTDKLLMRVFFN